ncbi:hypothetical protein SCLCIDRAFT_286943 [Scleroderma citrinum Foug A]|uniref:Uncharacterized protein n=1 Tax=Scleroderma citrinum Foug A TaxID=1036808 RepID=A0A0C3DI66_9AGAM|nr:hypothetical protein SCLCIDRAFT_286943 [Scleroderma citrinum Foug A]
MPDVASAPAISLSMFELRCARSERGKYITGVATPPSVHNFEGAGRLEGCERLNSVSVDVASRKPAPSLPKADQRFDGRQSFPLDYGLLSLAHLSEEVNNSYQKVHAEPSRAS